VYKFKYDYVEMRLQGVVMNSMIAPLKWTLKNNLLFIVK
jgi:hypothetical protein